MRLGGSAEVEGGGGVTFGLHPGYLGQISFAFGVFFHAFSSLDFGRVVSRTLLVFGSLWGSQGGVIFG